MTKKKTAPRPVAVLTPAPSLVDTMIDTRQATIGRLADQLAGVTQGFKGDAPGNRRQREHSCLCLTCGAAFDMSGGCSEDRPDQVEIPFETMLELNTLVSDLGDKLDPNEVGARLISIGLYVLGRGGYRERHDMIEFWEVSEERPREAAPAGA
jgi:hypothetical protein